MSKKIKKKCEISKKKKEKGLVRLFQRVHAVDDLLDSCLRRVNILELVLLVCTYDMTKVLGVLKFLCSTFLSARTAAHKENDTFTNTVLHITL